MTRRKFTHREKVGVFLFFFLQRTYLLAPGYHGGLFRAGLMLTCVGKIHVHLSKCPPCVPNNSRHLDIHLNTYQLILWYINILYINYDKNTS